MVLSLNDEKLRDFFCFKNKLYHNYFILKATNKEIHTNVEAESQKANSARVISTPLTECSRRFFVSTFEGKAHGKTEYFNQKLRTTMNDLHFLKKVSAEEEIDNFADLRFLTRAYRWSPYRFQPASGDRVDAEGYATTYRRDGKVYRKRTHTAIRKIYNFESADYLVFDFDGTLSLDKAIERVRLLNYKCFIQTTKSHTESQHRFRIVIEAERTIYDADELIFLMKFISDEIFPEADKKCLDPARCFFASVKDVYLNDNGIQFPVNSILEEFNYIPPTISTKRPKHLRMQFIERKDIEQKLSFLTSLLKDENNNNNKNKKNNIIINKSIIDDYPLPINIRQIRSPNILESLEWQGKPGKSLDFLQYIISALKHSPIAISGQNGSATAYSAIVHAVGYAAQFVDIKSCNFIAELKNLVMEHYNPRCLPPWSESEIDQKIVSAVEWVEENPKWFRLKQNRKATKEKMSPRDAGIARSKGREMSKARKAFNALAVIGQVFVLIEKEMQSRNKPVVVKYIDANKTNKRGNGRLAITVNLLSISREKKRRDDSLRLGNTNRSADTMLIQRHTSVQSRQKILDECKPFADILQRFFKRKSIFLSPRPSGLVDCIRAGPD